MSDNQSPKHWHLDTSWQKLGVRTLPNGIQNSIFNLCGPGDEAGAPVIFHTTFPPNTRIDAHTHRCDYAEIVLAGSQCVTRKWFHPGDVRIVKAGTAYGPLVTGPEGATVLIIFRTGDWEPVRFPANEGEGLFEGSIKEMMA
jgi:hypothetical protein